MRDGRVPGHVQALVEGLEARHLGRRELEVEEGGVLGDARAMDRLGQRHEALLQGPAEHDLRRRPGVRRGHRLHDRVMQAPAAGQRAVGLDGDAVSPAEVDQRGLGEERVQLELVDHRRHVRRRQQLAQVRLHVVADADRACPALGVDRLQRAPAPRPSFEHGPVDEVQVDVLEADGGEAPLERPPCGVVAVVPVAQLGGDEDFAAGDAGGAQCRADVPLVAVDVRRVDVPVAQLERPTHRILCLVAGPGAEDPQPEHWQVNAAGQLDAGADLHGRSRTAPATRPGPGAAAPGRRACGSGRCSTCAPCSRW